ncbi:MAG: trypsin-like peptidase domain-containing protein [Kiritimatiellae bacterium]|nr:trypsin-like peptidase domain-containing protein [Kiritimatiellia bacterium]
MRFTVPHRGLRAASVVAAAACMLAAGCLTAPADGNGFRSVILDTRRKVAPALVYIRVVREALEGGKNERQVVAGSGVVITPDGELLTNHHVVDKATEIRCQLSDGTARTARKIGSDKDLDVALLKLECPSNAPPFAAAELAPTPVTVGDVVLAMGAPWGLARSVTMGIVSCTDRYLEGCGQYTLWYQTDAAIAPGNSGGPLVDTQGRVVGLNTRGNLFGGQAFTIPSPTILEVLPRLRAHGDAHWAWFGLNLQPLHDFNRDMTFPGGTGVIVAGTDAGSPARKAGLLPNDRIVAVDGEPVTVVNNEDLPAFNRRLGRLDFGKEVAFSVMRGGKEMTFGIAPTEKGRVEGAQKAFERWGFTAKEINRFDTPDLAFFAEDGGLFVSAVAWDGNAWSAGLKEKDVLLSWDGKPVKTLDGLSRTYEAALKDLPNRYRANIEVMRRGRRAQVVLNYLEDTEKEVLE